MGKHRTGKDKGGKKRKEKEGRKQGKVKNVVNPSDSSIIVPSKIPYSPKSPHSTSTNGETTLSFDLPSLSEGGSEKKKRKRRASFTSSYSAETSSKRRRHTPPPITTSSNAGDEGIGLLDLMAPPIDPSLHNRQHISSQDRQHHHQQESGQDQLNAFFNSLTSNPFYPSRDGNVDLTTTTDAEEDELSSYLNSPVAVRPTPFYSNEIPGSVGDGHASNLLESPNLLAASPEDIFRAIQSSMWSNQTTSLEAIEGPRSSLTTNERNDSKTKIKSSQSTIGKVKDEGRRKSSIANITVRPPGTSSGPILSTAARVSKKECVGMTVDVQPKNGEEVECGGKDVPLDMLSDRQILTTRWLSTAQLKEIGTTRGRDIYKKGKFTHDEELKIKGALDKYMSRNGLDFEGLRGKVFSGRTRNADPSSSFWSEIAEAVQGRPLISVYQHVRRMCHPLSHQGAWTAEQDQMLLQAVADLGTKWEKVSQRVERMAQDCRDRYRNYLKNGELKNKGLWSKEETEKLKQAVEDVCSALGKKKGDYSDIPWTAVSEKMKWVRTRAQCRIKWQDSVEKEVKAARGEAQLRVWDQDDTFYMFKKVKELNVADESEIDWEILRDKEWNLFSSHQIQKRFLSLKRTIKNHKDLTFKELLDAIENDFEEFKMSKKPLRKGEHPKKKTKDAIVLQEEEMSDFDNED